MIGTDSGVPLTFHSQSTWNELEIWVNEFGIDPMYAIRAATYWPSLWMGVSEKVGTITPGKKADIIFLRNSDLNLKNSFNPLHSVVCYGHPGNVDTVIIEVL